MVGYSSTDTLTYHQKLSQLLYAWPTLSSTNRDIRIRDLASALTESSPTAYAALSVVTTHTLSLLLSGDAARSEPKPTWSRHAQYSEQLVISLLNLLLKVLTPHHHLKAPPPSAFVLLFQPAQAEIPPPDDGPYWPHLDVLRHAFEHATPRPHHFSLAFLFSQLAVLFEHEPSFSIRQLSLNVLAALIDAIDACLLAAFLPGLVSKLISITALSPRMHSSVAIPALKALRLLILRTFPRPDDPELPPLGQLKSISSTLLSLSLSGRDWGSTSKASESNDVASASSQPTGRVKSDTGSLRVIVDAEWCAKASGKLHPLLAMLVLSNTGPRTHTLPSIRIAFIRFLSDMLDARVVLDHSLVALFKFALLESCAHAMPAVANEALEKVHTFFSQNGVVEFERAILATLHFASFSENTDTPPSRTMQVDFDALKKLGSSSDDDLVTRLGFGVLAVLIPNPSVGLGMFVVPPQRLFSFLNRVGVSGVTRMLIFLHESHWRPASVAKDTVSDAMANQVLDTAFQMGKVGLLSCVYVPLYTLACPRNTERDLTSSEMGDGPDRDLDYFKPRAHSALLLHAVLNGAMVAGLRSEADRAGHISHVERCSKEILESISCLFVPSVQAATTEEFSKVDDATITLKLALLQALSSTVRNLTLFHRRYKMGPVSSGILLGFLMNLLRDVAHGEKALRPAARDSLQEIAEHFRCETERKLILRHLNFIVARVIRNLQQGWAGDVLQLVIGNDGDDVSREATSLLRRTLKGLSDNLAGVGDTEALRMLQSIRSVLVTAVAQSEHHENAGNEVEMLPEDGIDLERGSIEEEVAVVHRSLMSYCIDDAEDKDEPLAPNANREGNDLFKGFDDGAESLKVAFEDVAVNALDGAQDLLVVGAWKVRADALNCATLAARLLRKRRKVLLPHVAKLLPLIPDQFACMNETLNAGERMVRAMKERKVGRRWYDDDVNDLVKFVNAKGGELPVVRNACLLLCALAEYAGSFIRERFVRLIFPKMQPLLRLCTSFPTLLSRVFDGDLPSHGAMAACDACLEAIACIARHTPIAVAPYASVLTNFVVVYFDGRFDPETGADRDIVHGNRRMVRLEKERWNRRVVLAEIIVRGLAKVNEGDVFCSLLCADDGSDEVIKSGKLELFDIIVR